MLPKNQAPIAITLYGEFADALVRQVQVGSHDLRNFGFAYLQAMLLDRLLLDHLGVCNRYVILHQLVYGIRNSKVSLFDLLLLPLLVSELFRVNPKNYFE